jgi:quinoprotein glucose dehydrogenase
MGGAVIDNYSDRVPSGVIRGFDIYSGRLIWVFDAGNPDPNEMPSDDHHFTAGSPNSWAVSAVDENLGLVYVPLGSSSPDIWGGNRSADSERYDSALVALDIATGKLRWFFQNVHHDLWDMDMPSQPSLVDLHSGNDVTPAIYIPAKTGNIFVLDRRDGHLLVPAPEQAVPQGAAPGDRLSPTQPFSDLSFRPRDKLTDAQMWGSTMFDQLACRIQFKRLRYEGPFTPPSEQGTLVFPGDFGMFEWGGIAVDPRRQIAIANPQSIPFVSRLVPRGKNNPAAPNAEHPPGTELGVQPMYGAPYGVELGIFLSPLGIPCLEPPWGSLAAIDLKTNKVVWQHRVGTIRDEAPPLPFKLGVPMLGGPMVTVGGVAFLTSTMDDYIRAFDVNDGRLLWQDRLPAGGQSTPMTYEVSGKQYVVTVDGGHGSFGTRLGDYVRAYALPN